MESECGCAPNRINVLGSTYTIEHVPKRDDRHFDECDGYCDETTKKIVLPIMDADGMDKGNLQEHWRKVTRHEIVHAFLFESGLAENSSWAQNEELVDWIAFQFPKMMKAMQDAGAFGIEPDMARTRYRGIDGVIHDA